MLPPSWPLLVPPPFPPPAPMAVMLLAVCGGCTCPQEEGSAGQDGLQIFGNSYSRAQPFSLKAIGCPREKPSRRKEGPPCPCSHHPGSQQGSPTSFPLDHPHLRQGYAPTKAEGTAGRAGALGFMSPSSLGLLPGPPPLPVCAPSSSVVPSSLQPHGLQPARLLCPWGFSRQEAWSGLLCPPLVFHIFYPRAGGKGMTPKDLMRHPSCRPLKSLRQPSEL